MKKNKCFYFMLIGLFSIMFLGSVEVIAQESNYDKLLRIFGENGWYNGCPQCRNLFGPAFKETTKGSSRWEKLVILHSGCLMEDHRETEAINRLEDALNYSPSNHLFLSGIGTAYMRMQDDEKAEEYFMQSNAVKPNRDSYYKLAFLHYKKGARIPNLDIDGQRRRQDLLTKAEEAINKSTALYYDVRSDSLETGASRHGRTAGLSLLADIYEAQAKIEEAINIRRQLIDTVKDEQDWSSERKLFALTEFKFALGQLLFQNGQKEEGLELMNNAIESAPTEDLKRVKEMLLDLTVNPTAMSEFNEKARYPQLKEGSFIPLY